MRIFRKLIAPALTLALMAALCAVPVAAAPADVPAAAPATAENCYLPKIREGGAFSDTKGLWCEEYVRICYETGLLNGKSADRFDPSGTLTQAQRLVIGVRLYTLLRGLPAPEAPAAGEPWWLPSARYYQAVDGDTETDSADIAAALRADEPADRLSFACQMVWSTPSSLLTPLNAISSLPEFGGELEKQMLSLYQAGIVNGVDRLGTFNPTGTLTRGQAAAMLARILAPAQRLRFTLPDAQTFDLCADVYRIDRTATVLTIGGVKVTMEQFAYPLSIYLRAGAFAPVDSAGQTLTELLDMAIADERENIAIDFLCAQKNPPAVSGGTFAISRLGLTDAAVDWEASHDFRYQSLLAAYKKLGQTEEALQRDLDTLGASLTVTPAPALTELDLAAAQTRLKGSLFCDGYGA